MSWFNSQEDHLFGSEEAETTFGLTPEALEITTEDFTCSYAVDLWQPEAETTVLMNSDDTVPYEQEDILLDVSSEFPLYNPDATLPYKPGEEVSDVAIKSSKRSRYRTRCNTELRDIN